VKISPHSTLSDTILAYILTSRLHFSHLHYYKQTDCLDINTYEIGLWP